MFSRVLGGRLKPMCGSGIVFTLWPKRGPAPGHLEDISRFPSTFPLQGGTQVGNLAQAGGGRELLPTEL